MVANLFWIVIGIIAFIYYSAKEDFLGTCENVGVAAVCIFVLWIISLFC